jgi:disulfide bond formation protein DsbB
MTMATETASGVNSSNARAPVASVWLLLALLLAVLGIAGSLHLSLGMNLKACTLCFYQRTFMMSLVAVLGVGLLSGLGRTGRLGLLALPLAIAGLGVAAFHVNLEVSGKLECPSGYQGWGTVPQQSLAAFVGLTGILLIEVVTAQSAGWVRWPLLICGVAVGGGLALASCTSNPPMPAAPPKPYTTPPDTCRPPYEGHWHSTPF